MGRPSTLFFYPVFPRYRKAILEALVARHSNVRVIGGVDSCAGLTPLTRSLFPSLERLTMWRFAGLSWHRGALKACLADDCGVAVLAPAVRSLSTWVILATRRITRRRTYLWGQCGKPGSRGIKRGLQELLNRMATGLLVYGESERDAACELGTPKAKISIVLNANASHAELTADLEPYPSLYRRRDLATKGSVTLAYVGRLISRKRLDVLVQAAANLCRMGWPTRVMLVGSGPASRSLVQLARGLGVRIDTIGEVHSRSDIRLLLNRATLVVSPREIGLLAIDGLVHGIPILVPNNAAENGPEVESLSLGVNALQVRPTDADDIAGTVDRWLRSTSLPSQELFDSARRSALAAWSAENVADRILQAVGQGF